MAAVSNKVEVIVRGRTRRISPDSYNKIVAMASWQAVQKHGIESTYNRGLHVAEEQEKLLKNGVRSALRRWRRWNPQRSM